MPFAKRRRGDDEKPEDTGHGATPVLKKRRRGIQYDPVCFINALLGIVLAHWHDDPQY